ncbi:MutS domain V family protein [Clavispora lusitaniae]|uniref:MutS domain V family protein n=1 Tax=Clavispora lusitaniae TaxID=36911 RepID=UPI0016BB6D42|nr:Mismatch repair protein msh3 [Clavispora lusitaniae]KAF7581326.1 MutS domain V family protein [Clavispora lusitaniae]
MSGSSKRQKSISSFFTPVKTKVTPSPNPSADADTPTKDNAIKRKLEHFTHSNNTSPIVPKKARAIPSKKPSENAKRTASSTAKSKLTPLEKQFIDLKSDHGDKILAIQVGYKFKFFGNDAVTASKLLNIMLLPGNLELDERTHDRFAYCSIPDNRLHVHLQRLLNHGLKVGVVKQTETAAIKSVESSNKSGLFERKLTGVYTKATYMGDELLTGDPTISRSNNVADSLDGETYVLCVNESNFSKQTSLVAVQPLTGDIVFDVFSDTQSRDELETRLMYFNPSEVIVITEDEKISPETSKVLKLKNSAMAITQKIQRSETEIKSDMHEFFSSVDPDGHNAYLTEHYTLNYPLGIQACIIELIDYLSEFKLSNIFTIPSNFSSLTDAHMYMVLPASTLKALDIFEVNEDPTTKKGTLLWLLDNTFTRKGSRTLRKWINRPLVKREEIEQRAKAVDVLKSGAFVHILDAFKQAVMKIGKSGVDLDRSLIKIHYSATYKSNKITRKDLYNMLRSFHDILELFRSFGAKGIEEFKSVHDCPLLISILEDMLSLSENHTVDELLKSINPSGALSDQNLNEQKIKFFDLNQEKFHKISKELDEIARVERKLDEELQNIRKVLKRPQLSFITNFKETHLIEVRNGKNVDALPSDWVKISGTKTVSRFRTPEVTKLHKELQYHNDMLLIACDECFNFFLSEVDSEYIYLRRIVDNLATFDCLLSLARSAADVGDVTFIRPKLVDEQVMSVKNSVHPILLNLPQNNGQYVPNDIKLSTDDNRVLIITGPNMGGKSSYVKQIALLAIMTQIGCLLPCSSATMGIFDSIFIRMGASDNILRGKSTFLVEMLESANIIQNYTPKSLVILDEIGRGTGTSDGISLAYAILRYIIEDKKKPLTLFITHFPSLSTLETEFNDVKNFHMAFVEKKRNEGKESEWPEVIFLYKLVSGVVSNSYGLNVAKLAGIDDSIIQSAYNVSESMKRLIEKRSLLQLLSQMTPDNAAQILKEASSIV